MEHGGVWERSFYLSEELAEELVQLKVKSVGLDFISPDEVTTETSPIHHILLGNNIYLIENLTNLDAIHTKRFFFSAAPLKIKDSDGAFARAFAVIFKQTIQKAKDKSLTFASIFI